MKVLVVESEPQAAEGRQLRHEAIAAKVLNWTLDHRHLPIDGTRADVRRHPGGLQVTLSVPSGTPTVAQDLAAVRVAGALRAFDPHSPRIDISCEVNA